MILSLFLAGSASAAIERQVEKTFPAPRAGTLNVSTQGGSIRVVTHDEPVVKVTARQRIHADSEEKADELLQKLELTMEQRGADVHVVSRYPDRPSGFRFGSWPPVRVDITVALPAAYAAELRTSGGNITTGDLQGRVMARTSGGSIQLGQLGGEVEARTSGGNIALGGARGAANLDTSGGSISVGRVDGGVRLTTSGGNISIDAAGGAIEARTSGGSIRAALTGPLREDASLSTSGGNIRVTVAPALAFRLDASTSGGGVDAKGLTLQVEKSSRGRLSGAVNGGGPLLKLRTSGGSIALRTE